MKEYCVLKKDDALRKLQSLIKLYSECNNHDSLQELNLQHVLNRATSEESKNKIKDHWHNVEKKINYEIYALCNLLSKSKGSLPKGYSFIIKLQPELARDISSTMYQSAGIELEIMNIEI